MTSASSRFKSTVVALAALALGVAGCGSTNTCKSGTLLVTLTFDAATATATQLVVDVSAPGASPRQHQLDHQAGMTTGTIEIDFPDGYAAGQTVQVTVTRLRRRRGGRERDRIGDVGQRMQHADAALRRLGRRRRTGGASGGAGGKSTAAPAARAPVAQRRRGRLRAARRQDRRAAPGDGHRGTGTGGTGTGGSGTGGSRHRRRGRRGLRLQVGGGLLQRHRRRLQREDRLRGSGVHADHGVRRRSWKHLPGRRRDRDGDHHLPVQLHRRRDGPQRGAQRSGGDLLQRLLVHRLHQLQHLALLVFHGGGLHADTAKTGGHWSGRSPAARCACSRRGPSLSTAARLSGQQPHQGRQRLHGVGDAHHRRHVMDDAEEVLRRQPPRRRLQPRLRLRPQAGAAHQSLRPRRWQPDLSGRLLGPDRHLVQGDERQPRLRGLRLRDRDARATARRSC